MQKRLAEGAQLGNWTQLCRSQQISRATLQTRLMPTCKRGHHQPNLSTLRPVQLKSTYSQPRRSSRGKEEAPAISRRSLSAIARLLRSRPSRNTSDVSNSAAGADVAPLSSQTALLPCFFFPLPVLRLDPLRLVSYDVSVSITLARDLPSGMTYIPEGVGILTVQKESRRA